MAKWREPFNPLSIQPFRHPGTSPEKRSFVAMKGFYCILLLILSNVFMTFA